MADAAEEQAEDFVIAAGVQHSVRQFVERAAAELGIRLRFEGEGIHGVGRGASVEGELANCNPGGVIVKVDPRYFRPTEVETLLGDPGKAQDNLGWQPTTGFEVRVHEMVKRDDASAQRDGLVKPSGFQAYDRHDRTRPAAPRLPCRRQAGRHGVRESAPGMRPACGRRPGHAGSGMKLSNIAWNLMGLGLPLVVALLCIPPLLQSLGNERFGLLSLAWALTAVAGLFDLGIGRAATRAVAERLGSSAQGGIPAVITQAVRLTRRAGLAGAALAAVAVWAGATSYLKTSPDLADETRIAAYLLVLVIPLQAGTATYRGICEGLQRFRGINVVRVLLGIGNFGVPLAMTTITSHLGWIVGSLVGTRLLAWWAYRVLARVNLPSADDSADASQPASGLLASSLWFTASTLVGALLAQADRFFISTNLTVAQVPTYTVPLDIVTQLFLVVSAVSTVAFPSLATQLARDRAQAWQLFTRWFGRVAVLMAAVALGAAVVLPVFMPLWIKALLPAESITIALVLCIGLWTHSLGVMCMSMLHAAGLFKETALINMVELPVYFIALSVLVERFGVTGAAIAWVGRVTVDAALLYLLCWRSIRKPSSTAVQPSPGSADY